MPIAVDALRRAASAWGSDADVSPVLVARYLAPATRERIVREGAGYVDATGNVRLQTERPALWLGDPGQNRDPWRGPGRPRGSLQGPPAARGVRALIDFAPPYNVPELADRASASSGATYRVVDFLDEEGLLTRERYGPIGKVRWLEILERWSRDYGFAQSNTVQTFLEPRGLSALTERLAESKLDYVVTGSLAAERVAAYAPARIATVYVRDLPGAAEALGLRWTESGANVALAGGSTTSSSIARRSLTGCVSPRCRRLPWTCSAAQAATRAKRMHCLTGWPLMSRAGDVDLLVAARSALLDALEALVDQRDALVLIGAQAIYLHTGAAQPGSWIVAGDERRVTINVAGPAALLIAKLHKLGERHRDESRLIDKDAHDIYRLLVAVETATLAQRVDTLVGDELAGPATGQALDYLRELFATPDAVGSVMAGRAKELIGNPAVVGAAVTALAGDLLAALSVGS